jgi:hypothetical protein
MPFHHYVFNGMLHGIAIASGKIIQRGPERFKPEMDPAVSAEAVASEVPQGKA